MSEDPASPKPRAFTFRAGPRKEPLPREKAKRQGDITSLAFSHLGGREGAIAFLNNPDPELGGRPLDIAMDSEEGCQRVRDAILRTAGATARRR